jgi:4-amino-4-deoxy-L-arabinose transferase-like glycosyltransferase
LFCAAYVLPGFVGRGPWKSADITTFGVMQDLLAGTAGWLQPQLASQHGGYDSLLPFWLGALSIKLLPVLDPALAARLPFMLLLVLTLAATWYAVYHLARSPQAQPVAFAFGGEASPADYARAIADAGLLALMACLGLAQLSHETTPALAQLGFTSLLLYSLAAGPYRQGLSTGVAALGVVAGMVGLALSGAPTVAALFGLGAMVLEWLNSRHRRSVASAFEPEHEASPIKPWLLMLLLTTLGVAWLSYALHLWHWRIDLSGLSRTASQKESAGMVRLLLWFAWPAWPLALWTLWRWRRQLSSRHVALPLWFAAVAVGSTLVTSASDRALLLALPALAALAAFALPTLQRSVASLIDWFTLLFFTTCGLIIWVVWLAMQTGIPRQPAANVARLAPGFEPSFSMIAFSAALLATLAWAWLVKWRTGKHRSAIWKSLVLPAAGTTLCWLLLMTLWLPLLDYARSYAPLSRQVARLVDPQACVETHGLSAAQASALRYHSKLRLREANQTASCPYLVVDTDAQASLRQQVDMKNWRYLSTVRRPTDKNEDLLIFQRAAPQAQSPAAAP